MKVDRRYIYLGDRWTCPELRGVICRAVLRPDGKCIRGKNGNMLVEMANGERHNVVGKRLRKQEGRE